MSDKFYLGAAVFWTMLTLYLSLISARTAANFNIWDFAGTDKIAHMVFYAVFSFLWCMSLRKRNVEKKYVLIFSFSFGVLMEIFQNIFDIATMPLGENVLQKWNPSFGWAMPLSSFLCANKLLQ